MAAAISLSQGVSRQGKLRDSSPGFVRLNPDGTLDETSPRLNPDGTTNPTSIIGST